MSTEENKEIIRRWIEVWNTGELGPLEELIAPDFVYHNASVTLRPESGSEWYRAHIAGVRGEFPDFHVTAEDLLADGDKVIGRWSWGGTHQGKAETPWGAIATAAGKKVTSTTITITRLANGRIAEEWWQLDRLGYLQQLGAIPTPAPVTT